MYYCHTLSMQNNALLNVYNMKSVELIDQCPNNNLGLGLHNQVVFSSVGLPYYYKQ